MDVILAIFVVDIATVRVFVVAMAQRGQRSRIQDELRHFVRSLCELIARMDYTLEILLTFQIDASRKKINHEENLSGCFYEDEET